MRIALVSPLFEAVPPKRYGGTERIVSYLTEELVRLGHDVTLFASGDSVTTARLVAPRRLALRLDGTCKDWLSHHALMLEQVLQRADDFDVIHYHVETFHLPAARRCSVPSLTTLHGRLDGPDLTPLYREFSDVPMVSISRSQRSPLPFVNWVDTVYHGIPRDLFSPSRAAPREDYLVFLGRMSPEKGPLEAIAIATAAGKRLKMAAKVDEADREFFETRIVPLLEDPTVEYLGEVGDDEKHDLLSNALALLFPIDWPEPFGLVMIEAMACGTPVIARLRGSVPEIVEESVTGFIFENRTEAIAAVHRACAFDRARCRSAFEERFTATRMAKDYVNIYGRLIEGPVSESGLRTEFSHAAAAPQPL